MKKETLKKIFIWMPAVIGFISGLFDIINGSEKAISQLSKLLNYFSRVLVFGNNKSIQLMKPFNQFFSEFLFYFSLLVLLPFAIILFFSAFINFLTRNYRIKIGTHGIPCTLFTMIRFKVANKNNKLLTSIHRDIYHHYFKIKENIRYQRYGSIDDVNHALEEFLRVIHASIYKTFKQDFTINIKRLNQDRQGNLCLVPFIHYRGVAERNQANQRDYNYIYYIEVIEYERLSRYAQRARNYNNDRGYEVNSIFTYLINQKTRYWMSNDLMVDQRNGDFYTSSDNFPESYQSFAVFSITPPEKNVVPEGLLIFDTKKTGRFSEKECKNLFGYIAHLFYELLIEYNNYESKKK